jgi:nitrogen fixation/metabolism regulation signal transduction histidine kinase
MQENSKAATISFLQGLKLRFEALMSNPKDPKGSGLLPDEQRLPAPIVSSLKESYRLTILGSLASKIIYELNNPLTVVGANLNRIAECLHAGEARGALADEGQELTNEINESVDSIRMLLSSLGDFVKGDKKPDHYPLKEVVETALAVVSVKNRYAADVRVETMKDDIFLYGRKGHLQQLIVGVLLHIGARPTEFGPVNVKIEATGDDKVILEFCDERNPAVQAVVPDGSKLADFDAEMGLMLARFIVDDHSGTFEMHEDGQVATYRVVLPVSVG